MEKNKLMMIIIIVLLIVLLGTIMAVSFFTLNAIKNNAAAAEQGQANNAATPELKLEEIDSVSLGDTISTNLLTGADGKDHVIAVSVSVGIDNTQKKKSTEFLEMFTAKATMARAACIEIIGKKTYEEVNSADGQQALKEEMLTQLQEQFQSNLIVKVFFEDVITQ